MRQVDTVRAAPGSWFTTLPAAHRAAFLESGQEVAFRDGAAVYRQGDAPNGFWAVLAGEVRLLGHARPGNEMLALAVREGEWFGEVSMLDDGPRPHDAVAHGATRLHHVSVPAFAALTARMPLLFRDVARLVCRRERAALDYIVHAMALSTRARLAQVLLEMTRAGAGELAMRQEDLASTLGVSRQTLNRHLGALAAAGCVGRSYARIRVTDRSALMAEVQLRPGG